MSHFEEEYSDEEPEKEGESWKPLYKLNKELQIHIKRISDTLQSMLSLIDDEDDLAKSHLEMMLGDSWNVGAKLSGAQAGDSYLIYMENASIIRLLMRGIKSFTYSLEMENKYGDDSGIEAPYIKVLREEIEQFRVVFSEWVKTFQKDDFEDEWGLY